MEFKSSVFFALAGIVLLGAGCAQQIQIQGYSQNDNFRGGNTGAVIENDTTVQSTSSDIIMEEKTWEAPTVLPEGELLGKFIHLDTEKGKIVIETYGDTAPLTVSNFISLTKQGYYDGLTFHRREEGFVIQGGDPNGNGTGGPGYAFPDELEDDYRYERGVVAMANRGPDTNGSQFFIMLDDAGLPKAYTIFGRVVEGMDVVDAIVIGDKMTKVTIEDSK